MMGINYSNYVSSYVRLADLCAHMNKLVQISFCCIAGISSSCYQASKSLEL